MPWFDSAEPGIHPGLLLPGVLITGLPVLLFGLVRLLAVPLAVCFEVRAASRRRRGAPTLWDEWPSVSIVVPAFNAAAVIENCVRSVQLTRYTRYEVILVDDGSTDNTAELMAGLAAGDPRIKVLGQPGAGKGAALNLGVRYATGDVLVFVDADRIFAPYTVDRMLQGFEDQRTGAVCGDDRPVQLHRTRPLAFISHLGTAMARRALAVAGCAPFVSGNIDAFPRRVLAEIGPFCQHSVGAELELIWRVRKAGYRVAFAPRAHIYAGTPSTVLARWRQRVRRAHGLLQAMTTHRGTSGKEGHRDKSARTGVGTASPRPRSLRTRTATSARTGAATGAQTGARTGAQTSARPDDDAWAALREAWA
ncbi:glycosyltransferase [Arthrobacter sp. UYCu723]